MRTHSLTIALAYASLALLPTSLALAEPADPLESDPVPPTLSTVGIGVKDLKT